MNYYYYIYYINIRNSLFKMNISSNDKNEYNNMTFIIIL